MSATAVARNDHLEFLSDTIPKTTTYRQFKEKKAQEEAANKKVPSLPAGLPNGVNGHSKSKSIDKMMLQQQLKNEASGEIEANGVDHADATTPSQVINGSPMADRTLHPSPHGHPDPVRDIEMSG